MLLWKKKKSNEELINLTSSIIYQTGDPLDTGNARDPQTLARE